MFTYKRISRLFSYVSFKFSIIILIFLFLINLILLYNIKYIGYVQNTAPLLQNRQNTLEKEKKNGRLKSEKCNPSNLTIHLDQRISLLKNQIGDFYFIGPNSTELPQRIERFQKTIFNDFITSESVEIYFPNVQILKMLKEATLLRAMNAQKGSQLKLLLYLSNNMTAIFKPKWYSPHEFINGTVYAGKDRHYGEVVAFYISILLNFTRVPVATIRKINLRELLLTADPKLLETFITKDGKTCFYGVCPYCSPADLLCIDDDYLEGAIIFHLPSEFKLKIGKHPWRRTYRCNMFARWEKNEDYCASVMQSKFYSQQVNRELLLDLMDVSVFDFIIDNGDRHHYEYIENNSIPRLLILDNGKSFGNPHVDHIDILAPIYQCCLLRNFTWNTLLHLRGGNLSYWLRYLLTFDGDLVFDELHFEAINRRLIIIFTVLKDCFKRKGMQNVILD